MGSREATQADFDLERFINMFDEALTSNDPRVKNALQSLMVVVILTQPETPSNTRIGPLRQLYDDVHNINRRLGRVEEEVRRNQIRPQSAAWTGSDAAKYAMSPITHPVHQYDDEVMRNIAAKINRPTPME